MDLYPSIDIRGGRVVRLVQGDYDQETDYGLDPVAVARDFEAQGAPWIHVVDLDASLGSGSNQDAVADIVRAVAVPVQTGGGQRDDSMLKLGVFRIVLGWVAVKEPGLVARLATQYPSRVAVGLDHRHGIVAVRGWTESSGQRVDDMIVGFTDAG